MDWDIYVVIRFYTPPYLAPVPYRGKRNEPAYIKLIADKLSSLCNLSVEEIAELTTENAKKLFKLR